MERMFGRPIVTQEQMRARIRELGRQISADFAGKDLVLIGVLKGAYAFYADLARAIRIPVPRAMQSGSTTESTYKTFLTMVYRIKAPISTTTT